MPATTTPEVRFQEFRQRSGLSYDEAARLMGISPESVRDIEDYDDEISDCYSPGEVRRFCQVFGVRPTELFGIEITEFPMSARELANLIDDECRSRGITMEQFGDAVGWRLSGCIEPPERLLEDMTIEGIRWLCRELHIDWQRVISGL